MRGESSNRRFGQRSGYTVYCTTNNGSRDIGAQSRFVGAIFTCLGALVILGRLFYFGIQAFFKRYIDFQPGV